MQIFLLGGVTIVGALIYAVSGLEQARTDR